MVQHAKRSDEPDSRQAAQFLEDLIDACVMEVYFADHMAEKNLRILDDTGVLLHDYDRDATESKQLESLTAFIKPPMLPNTPSVTACCA